MNISNRCLFNKKHTTPIYLQVYSWQYTQTHTQTNTHTHTAPYIVYCIKGIIYRVLYVVEHWLEWEIYNRPLHDRNDTRLIVLQVYFITEVHHTSSTWGI